MKKVYLSDLPKKGGSVDWKKSVGKKVKFLYNSLEGEVEIIKYENKYLIIIYKDKEEKIHIANFVNCKLGKILNIRTSNYKIELGNTFKDRKRDIKIIGRKYVAKESLGKIINYKYYKYLCNDCGYQGWNTESNILIHNQGCSVCKSKTILSAVNAIYSTDPWMIDLGISEVDAKKYTSLSSKKVEVTCGDCGEKKMICINKVYYRKSIGCRCGDGYRYPAKFMMSILNQLGVEFELEFNSKRWGINIGRRYDFYLPQDNIIIEVHGEQHYAENSKFSRTLREEQKNDELKEKIAKQAGINRYIVIDCKISEREYIKNSVAESELSTIFDINKIDWNQCDCDAQKNMLKKVCEMKKMDPQSTVSYLANEMKISTTTVRRWLNKGTKLGLCQYRGVVENQRPIEVFKDDKSFGVFPSASSIESISEDLFGIKLLHRNISLAANGKQKHHHHFNFRYIN